MTRRLSGLAISLGLVVLGGLGFEPVASGAMLNCKISNRATKQSFPNLQSAVNAASRGATLVVEGTCTGTTTVSTDLTLKGQRRGGLSAPTLDGGGGGAVLTMDSGTTVAIDSLTITGGNSTVVDVGGGITINGGLVTLNQSRVSGNTAPFGGGIENNSGALIVNNSRITNNTATFDGGGIDTYPAGTITLRGASRISDNAVVNGNGGGIANFDSGVVTLGARSSISHNTASGAVGTASGSGGGVYNGCDVTNAVCTGAVTLRNASSIHNNIASGNGGGISNGGGVHNQAGLTVTLTDGSSIYANRAGGLGGGIFNYNGTLNGAVSEGNVYDNEPDDIS